MPLLDIAMCLGYLVERINPVNDRFEFARFDQFFENQHIFDFLTAVRINQDVYVDAAEAERSGLDGTMTEALYNLNEAEFPALAHYLSQLR